MSFQRILVAADSDPIAAHAGDIGADLARGLGAQLALVTAVDPSAAAAPGAGVPAHQLIALAEQDAKRLLAGWRERLGLPLSTLEFVRVGTPGPEIVKTAAEWPADLIVIGSHGRGGVSRALLGSVAEYVMRHAACPVLVIRANA